MSPIASMFAGDVATDANNLTHFVLTRRKRTTRPRRQPASIITLSMATEASAWPSGPHPEEEYALAHCVSALTFVLVVLVLGLGRSSVSRALTPVIKPNVAAPQKDLAVEHRRLMLLVWTRLLGELATVGCLALVLWLANRSRLLDVLADFSSKWGRPPPGVPHPEASWRTPVHAVANALSCHPRMPPDAVALLELASDAQFSLLLACALYFGFLAITLHTMMQWLEGYKRLECGASPRNPAEQFAYRQLDAMRSQLLGALRAEPGARNTLENSAEVKESVERGVLYVAHFLAEVRPKLSPETLTHPNPRPRPNPHQPPPSP